MQTGRDCGGGGGGETKLVLLKKKIKKDTLKIFPFCLVILIRVSTSFVHFHCKVVLFIP